VKNIVQRLILATCASLALATVALADSSVPFKVPDGWTAFGPDVIPRAVVVWRPRSGPQSQTASISLFAFRIPAVPTRRIGSTPHSGVAAPVSVRIGGVVYFSKYQVCGTKGQIMTLRVDGERGKITDILNYLEYRGYAYVMSYARSSEAMPDENAVSIINSLCPASPVAAAAHAPPSGWNATRPATAFVTVGGWQDGPHTLLLSRLPQESAVRMALRGGSTMLRDADPSTNVRVLSVRHTALCGRPAMIVASTYALFGVAFIGESAIAADPSNLYWLRYARPQGVPASSKAEAALLSLCPQPSPSPSPTPSPTPQPSSTPVPSASPGYQ
jgi:hypothetical protein